MDETKRPKHFTQIKVLEKKVVINFFERIEGDDDFFKNNYGSECEHAVHEDFRTKLDKLKGHLIRICEQDDSEDYQNIPEEILEKFKVHGFTISGVDENEAVILTGMRRLKTGQWMNLVTPNVSFENPDGYDQVGELYHDISEVKAEAGEYLNGKVGSGTQWSLSFDAKTSAEEHPTEHPEAEPAETPEKD